MIYFIFTNIWGFSPRRARKTTLFWGLDWLTETQPQCVSR
jgi:hypothetical protein